MSDVELVELASLADESLVSAALVVELEPSDVVPGSGGDVGPTPKLDALGDPGLQARARAVHRASGVAWRMSGSYRLKASGGTLAPRSRVPEPTRLRAERPRLPYTAQGLKLEGTYTLPMLLHSASLHMHTRASSGKLAKLGAASACLLEVPRWDFNWQGIYELEEPVPISPTLDQIYLECHYDNTGNDNAVLWGEANLIFKLTEDEKFLRFYHVYKRYRRRACPPRAWYEDASPRYPTGPWYEDTTTFLHGPCNGTARR